MSTAEIISEISPELLAESYRYCEKIARDQARNFYYSFLTLPHDQKLSMCAIYAFMRTTDDVSDEEGDPSDKKQQLNSWRISLESALTGKYGTSKILPAFHHTLIRYQIPPKYIRDLIDGAEMDLTISRYDTWSDLQNYCYKVASVVGFICLYVWGFDESEGKAILYGNACGLAFQLTNILRDISEDSQRNRVYLPQEDLMRYHVSEQTLQAGKMNQDLYSLLEFETERAECLYNEAEKLIPLVHPSGRPTLRIMIRIYRGILDDIKLNNYDVFSRRARASTLSKLRIVFSEWVNSKLKRK